MIFKNNLLNIYVGNFMGIPQIRRSLKRKVLKREKGSNKWGIKSTFDKIK